MNTNTFHYNNRITAFVDILGLSGHLLGSGGPKFAKNIVAIISEAISKDRTPSVKLSHIKSTHKVRVYFPGWHNDADDMDCHISSISDSIVISIPETTKRFGETKSPLFSVLVCLETVFHLQRLLLQLGILTRGGISAGKLYHADNIVIGDALVSAYRLESKCAIFPRVVIDPSVQNIMLKDETEDTKLMRERVANLFSQDHDGMYYVDYLGLDLMSIEDDWAKRLRRIELFVNQELLEIQDLIIMQKFRWLQSYIQKAKLYLQDNFKLFPHSTSGKLETAYPRRSASSGRQQSNH
jgi:hypothetical protein